MTIHVRQLRLTSIWTEFFPVVLERTLSAGDLLGQLARESRYQVPFEDARSGNGRLTLPWIHLPKGGQNYFWKYYLKRGTLSLDEVRPEVAWKRLTPLRAPLDARLSLSWPKDQGRISLESFYYPHGIALLATVTIKHALPLDDAVLRACEARSKQVYQVTWSDNTQESLNLNTLCEKALDATRKVAMGEDSAEGERPPTPFTIATIIDADLPPAFQLTEPVADQGPIHHALDGLCTFDANFPYMALAPLVDSQLRTRQTAASDLLYARPRARAVWFPTGFKSPVPTRRLACYHRNLVCACTQTEALIGLLRMGAPALQHNKSIPNSMRKLLQSAGGLVGLLHAGSEDIYQSASPQRQLRDCGALREINLVRQRLNGAAAPI